MLNILITGARGQLGSSLRQLGSVSPNNYLATDVAELDITDAGAVLQTVKEQRIDVIVNCAAYTNVEKAEEDEPTADLLNHKAAAYLAAAAKETGATLIHVSTDYVFDGTGHRPYTEDMATSPLGAYGRTKLAGEEAVKASGCRYLILRTAWLYSEYGNNFLKTMLRLTSEREDAARGLRPGGHSDLRRRPGACDLLPDRGGALCGQRGGVPLHRRGRVLVVRLRGGDRRGRGT